MSNDTITELFDDVSNLKATKRQPLFNIPIIVTGFSADKQRVYGYRVDTKEPIEAFSEDLSSKMSQQSLISDKAGQMSPGGTLMLQGAKLASNTAPHHTHSTAVFQTRWATMLSPNKESGSTFRVNARVRSPLFREDGSVLSSVDVMRKPIPINSLNDFYNSFYTSLDPTRSTAYPLVGIRISNTNEQGVIEQARLLTFYPANNADAFGAAPVASTQALYRSGDAAERLEKTAAVIERALPQPGVCVEVIPMSRYFTGKKTRQTLAKHAANNAPEIIWPLYPTYIDKQDQETGFGEIFVTLRAVEGGHVCTNALPLSYSNTRFTETGLVTAETPAPAQAQHAEQQTNQQPAPQQAQRPQQPAYQQPAPQQAQHTQQPAYQQPAPQQAQHTQQPAYQQPAPQQAQRTQQPAYQQPAPQQAQPTPQQAATTRIGPFATAENTANGWFVVTPPGIDHAIEADVLSTLHNEVANALVQDGKWIFRIEAKEIIEEKLETMSVALASIAPAYNVQSATVSPAAEPEFPGLDYDALASEVGDMFNTPTTHPGH